MQKVQIAVIGVSNPTDSQYQLAEEVGMSPSYLTRSALPDKDDADDPGLATGCRFPLKKLIPLIRASSDFRLLDYIERSLGRVAFSVPRNRPGFERLHAELSKSIKEFGELVKVVGDSLEDGKITDAEREHCTKEGYELIQAVALLLHSLDLKGGSGAIDKR